MGAGKYALSNFSGDAMGGTLAMLLSLPSAIAYGLVIFAPLGGEFSAMAAIGGITGTIAMGLICPLIGTRKLISAPCAPAAAVLSVFVTEMVHAGSIPLYVIPVYITLVSFLAGLTQVLIGNLGGGNFIKYIPYPVVTGYLWSVSLSIFGNQFPRMLGAPKGEKFFTALTHFSDWRWESIVIGLATVGAMIGLPRIIKGLPPIFLALLSGIAVYGVLAMTNPAMRQLHDNPFVVGPIAASTGDLARNLTTRWSLVTWLVPGLPLLKLIAIPVISLAVLLCINTLNACVVMDTLTYSRHDGRKELTGQGVGNMVSALCCGIPGGGLLNASVLSHKSNATGRLPGIAVGVTALMVLLLFGKIVAWLPLPALAGILVITAVRMVDLPNLPMLLKRSTILDFLVLAVVVFSALFSSLLIAATVGTAMAIYLFFRQQMQSSVIRSMVNGTGVFSKKMRTPEQLSFLEREGGKTLIVELQGPLFFGTTDQLIEKLNPELNNYQYLVFDMRKVQSVDFTAAKMLGQILERMQHGKNHLVFSSIPQSLPTKQNIRAYLTQLGLHESSHLHIFANLNDALEWVEDQILELSEHSMNQTKQLDNLGTLDLFKDFSSETMDSMLSAIEQRKYEQGAFIFRSGEISDEFYIVKAGVVRILLPLSDGQEHHLLTIGAGGIFGEMAFLDHVTRSADAQADTDVMLYILSKQKFEALAARYPAIAGKFYEHLALILANRLRQSNKELKLFNES